MITTRSPRPLIVAHRGDSRNFPENTLSSVRAAIVLGADVIELDVHRSADDIAVVIHDRTLTRTTGQDGRVDSLTAAEIDRLDAGSWRGADHAGAKVPRLAEIVEASGDARLCLEFKDGDYRAPDDAARWLVDQFARFALHRRAIVNPANADVAARVRHLNPDIRIALDYTPGATGLDMVSAAGADLLEVEHRAVTADMVRACKAAGLPVWAWTANEAVDWDRLCAAGVDAILTDDPAGLIAHLARAAPNLRL